jgi:hypothetical protein
MSARHDANRRLLRARDEMDRSYADGNSLRITQPADGPAAPPA